MTAPAGPIASAPPPDQTVLEAKPVWLQRITQLAFAAVLIGLAIPFIRDVAAGKSVWHSGADDDWLYFVALATAFLAGASYADPYVRKARDFLFYASLTALVFTLLSRAGHSLAWW